MRFRQAPDFKESMEIGRDWDATWRNMWPPEAAVPGFKQTMLNFFHTCHKLHFGVMRAIALGLQLDEHFFDDKIDEQYVPCTSSTVQNLRCHVGIITYGYSTIRLSRQLYCKRKARLVQAHIRTMVLLLCCSRTL
jgi:hypothetical protein